MYLLEIKGGKGMEKMIQDWLVRDWCDHCGEAIEQGDTIFLDVERECCGIIPAYCEKCRAK